jgi:predicted acetyltransferase
LSLDVGALTSLFTGYLSATDLARAGRLRGASGSALAALDATFCGPRPWLLEHF